MIYSRSVQTVSHHPFQLGVLAVLQHKQPVAEGALRAEGLQTKMKRCCQVFLSAPLLQLLEPLLKRRYIQNKYERLAGNSFTCVSLWNVTYQGLGPRSDQKQKLHSC